MKWTQTTPTDRPLTWAQLKRHLRLDDDTQRDDVMEMLDAAVAYAEQTMGRSLMPRTITATFYAFTTPPDPTYLPRGPVTAVTSLVDAQGNAVPPTNYVLEHVGNAARIRVNNGYTYPINLTATYTAGYATAAAIPWDLRHALKMHVFHLWENPGAFTDKALVPVPAGLEAFYRHYSWELGIG